MPISSSTTLAPSAILDGNTVIFSSIRDKFDALAETWEDKLGGSSVLNLNDVIYHQIIGMGAEIIPFLLERLRESEGHWIYALKCISGDQAESPEMHGDADRVINAWLAWGRARGIDVG